MQLLYNMLKLEEIRRFEDMYKEKIRLLMKQKKVTQKDLTKLTGVRQATISDWLNGKQDINVKTLEKLLKALE